MPGPRSLISSAFTFSSGTRKRFMSLSLFCPVRFSRLHLQDPSTPPDTFYRAGQANPSDLSLHAEVKNPTEKSSLQREN